jgi:N-acetylneuraminate synthase/N,N'-diacetyllegionaminate synthase
MILGTGMSNLKEIREAIKAIKLQKNNQIITLHCTTSYPCSYKDVNLRAMITMKNELGCLIGFSDHTLGNIASVMAVTLGAVVIEKHFTIDKSLPGPDHKASLEPNELFSFVNQIRDVEVILGDYEKKPTIQEQGILDNVRKSITASQDIKKGSIINEKMILIRRPGTGLSPDNLYKIIGKKAKKNMKKDHIFQTEDIE